MALGCTSRSLRDPERQIVGGSDGFRQGFLRDQEKLYCDLCALKRVRKWLAHLKRSVL